MAPRTALLAALVLVLAAAPASADLLQSTRRQQVRELSHTVEIRIEGGVAIYTVQRVFSNPGKLADQIELEIDLPSGAAATGLRIRANERWYDGDLLERAEAAARYRKLTGLGPYAAKDPALLAWMWADKLSLQVFPVMPGKSSTVEYTLTVPTRYDGGKYHVSYPRVAAPGATSSPGRSGVRTSQALAFPAITVRPSWADASTAITVDGKPAAAGVPIELAPPPRSAHDDDDPGASHATSSITVAPSSRTSRAFGKATVALDITHTYRGDLVVELETPAGRRVVVHDRAGAGDNDLHGAFEVKLPPGTTGAGTWKLRVSDHAALDTGTIDRWQLVLGKGADATTTAATDTPVFVPDAPENDLDGGVAAIAIAPPVIDTWTGRFGRVVASDQHAFGRLEIDMAPQLQPLPKRAQVVFVVDASHSMGPAGIAAQLEIARAYATHVPDADVEIVAVRRRAARVFGRFVPAEQLDRVLAEAVARGALAPGNGSALDDGARTAVAALADRTAGPRRIVIATDERLRSSLGDPAALASLASATRDTVVHVVVPGLARDDRAALVRRDNAPLAPLAARHHGIFADLSGLATIHGKALAPIVLELVRPTRIDGVAAAGWQLDRDVLAEGAGVRQLVAASEAATPDHLAITGRMWSDPVRLELAAGAPFSQHVAAFVFGADAHTGLGDAEMMRVARAGRAVSPVTSYVAAEPGTRPSPIGFPQEGGEEGGVAGGVSGGSVGGLGYGMIRVPPDLQARVDPRGCVRTVRPAASWTVRLDVETTGDEIVDVAVASGAGAMAACLVEAVWALRLDGKFDLARERFAVSLAGPPSP